MKRKIRLTENDIRMIVRESVDRVLSKPMKKNVLSPEHDKKISDFLKDGTIDLAAMARELYPDVAERPAKKAWEKLVRESVSKILRENAYTDAGVWDLLERLEGFMSDKDIIARIISRIGPDEAKSILNDIIAVEDQGGY